MQINRALRALGSALDRIMGGFALAFLLCAASALIAAWTRGDVWLPGVFRATAGTENGALALEVQANFVGIVIVTAVAAVVIALLTAQQKRHIHGRVGRD